MPQGMRFGWVRSIFASVGVTLCVGLLGCNSNDKPKDSLANKPLPGTPSLANGTPQYNGTTGTPGYTGTGAMTTGTTGTTAGMTQPGTLPRTSGLPTTNPIYPSTTGYNTSGTNSMSPSGPTSSPSFGSSGTGMSSPYSPTTSSTGFGSGSSLGGTSSIGGTSGMNYNQPLNTTSRPPTGGYPSVGTPGSFGVPQMGSTSGSPAGAGSGFNNTSIPMPGFDPNGPTPPLKP